ncbi:MAG: ComF family protein [Clostridia bacterium]|nr:ComF family protein [Clostridia bacterium]
MHKRETCRRCGQPVSECWCGIPFDKDRCITNEYHLVQYDKKADTIIKRLIYKMKSSRRNLLYYTVAQEMYTELFPRIEYTDLILTYVPRSKANITKYGHDHALRLTLSLSELSGIEIAHMLSHSGNSNQKKLNVLQRQQNAQKSYNIIKGAKNLINGKNVILIDDVMTTGSTVTRCAKLLKLRGARRVLVFTVAKTI